MSKIQETRTQIKWVILSTEKPFSVLRLCENLHQQYNINDRMLILEVLTDLLDSGLVKYSDMIGSFPLYESNLKKSA